ncbi:Integrator complex subunit 5, partial [Operophtera brumata]
MIGPELCSLGQSWAPFIAPWCINLIMDIATKKQNIPNVTLQSAEPEAIKEDAKPEKKRDVIPYLLNLASKSDIVLKALTQDIEQTLSPDVIERLTVLCLAQRHTAAWEGVTPSALVALLSRAHRSIPLIMSAAEEIYVVREKLLTGSQLEQYSVARMLILVKGSPGTAQKTYLHHFCMNIIKLLRRVDGQCAENVPPSLLYEYYQTIA